MAQQNTYDVIVVGAGISGINAAYRLKERLPNHSVTILEARTSVGGTWDFFRYPGLRSDSDLYTFGFAWRPWDKQKYIADGAEILSYIKESAASEGIDKMIQFEHKLVSADWSSENQQWKLNIEHNGKTKIFHSKFVLLGTGYYDYSEPLSAAIPGIKDFKGEIVHPQFWPEKLDYANKKVSIIGSGATAVTLLPVLAKTAAHVTMIQRSPTYLLSRPAEDVIVTFMSKIFPRWLTEKITRIRYLIVPHLFYKFCVTFPNVARNIIRLVTVRLLPKDVPYNPHFTPSYGPWTQRLCICPDADFFKSLHNGRANIATGVIETVTDKEVILKDGTHIETDILVTATGLKMSLAGGSKLSVDGVPIKIGEKFLWKGTMLQDVPNAMFLIGYTNASWTLGADAMAQLAIKIIKNLEAKNVTSAVPRAEHAEEMNSGSLLNLNSTYIKRAAESLPKVSDVGPWKARTSYWRDVWNLRFGDIQEGLQLFRITS